MLISFSAEPSPILDLFIEAFENPPGVVTRITHLWLYGNFRVHRFEDVVVIETNGMMELFAKYFFMISAMLLTVSILINNFSIFYFNIPFLIVCYIFVSGRYHSFNTIKQLRKFGYIGKVSYVNGLYARALLNHAKRNINDIKNKI